jgi:outer membrane protein assembly factor BamB
LVVVPCPAGKASHTLEVPRVGLCCPRDAWKVLSPTILVSTGIGMKLRTFLIIATLLTLTVAPLAVQGAASGSGPAPWPMLMANPGHTGRSAADTSADPGQAVTWIPYWATGNASVVISARGTYFASYGNVVYRLSSDYVNMNRYTGNDSLVGTPAVGWNDSVYVGSLDMHLYCLDGNATKWWQYNTSAPVWSSPTMLGNRTLYITSAGLMSFTLDGKLNWRVLQNVTSRSSPAVSGNGDIYFGGEDGVLYAVDRNGTPLWQYHTSGPIQTSPSIDGVGNIHFGSDDGGVYCLDQSGALLWKFDTGAPVRSSVGIRGDGASMILTGNGSLVALDPNGSLDWTAKLDGYNVTRSLAIDSQGICYVGSDTTLYSVQADGKVRWTYRISTGFVGAPAITSNGTVVFGSTTGIYELGHADQGNEWVVFAAVLVPPLVLCAALILAARRLLRTKTADLKKD